MIYFFNTKNKFIFKKAIIKKLIAKKYKAFSLLETAFAILLIGILTSMIIPYWQFLNMQNNIEITQIKANYIRKAIQGYVARYGFLPNAASDNDGLQKGGLNKGFVPYKTLGISKLYLYDGFGRHFTFVVNEYLTLYKNDDKKNGTSFALPIHMPSFMPHIIKSGVQYPILGSHFCRLHKYKVPSDDLHSNGFNFSPIKSVADIKNLILDYELDNLYIDNKLIITKNNESIIKNSKKINKFTMHKIVARFDKSIQNLLEKINNYDPSIVISFSNIKEFNLESQPINDLKPNASNLSINKVSEFIKHRKGVSPCLEEVGENMDAVAWILISHSKKNNKYTQQNKTADHIFTIDGLDLVFYQTRFNLAGQLNHPCSSNFEILLTVGLEGLIPAKINIKTEEKNKINF